MRYTVHYTGWLHDGTKLDSSVDRGQPFEFVQGRHGVITAGTRALTECSRRPKRPVFDAPGKLAYGAAGRGPIPAKADLIFDIEFHRPARPKRSSASTAGRTATNPAAVRLGTDSQLICTRWPGSSNCLVERGASAPRSACSDEATEPGPSAPPTHATIAAISTAALRLRHAFARLPIAPTSVDQVNAGQTRRES